MTNEENMKIFISTLDEDEDIINLKEDYELSKKDSYRLIEVLSDKAIEFDSKGKLLSVGEWKEIFMNSAIIITSSSYDVATGKKKKREKNFVPKAIDWTIDKLGKNDDFENYEDSYDDGNTFTK